MTQTSVVEKFDTDSILSSRSSVKNAAIKASKRLNKNFVVQLLNRATNELDFHFSEDRYESAVNINGAPPIFFSDNAGGKVAGGSASWVKSKHKNSSIHEPATVAAFSFVQQHFSSQIDVVFDIGALYGYFSLIGKSMFPSATVFSFEMNPSSYRALCNNISANKHLSIPATHCINVGLSDQTAFQQKVSVQDFILEEDKASEPEKLSVIDIMSVDDFCRISGSKPDLIKMDVEGYQAKILPGAIETIKAKRPIIILEFDAEQQMRKFGTSNKLITKPLFDLGYSCYWCKNQRSLRGNFQHLDYDTFSQKHETNSLSVFIP